MSVRILTPMLIVVLGLSGCGFQPLYAQPAGVGSSLSAISVATPSTRIGQLLREELEDELATQPDGTPRYRLTVELEERRFARGLRIDDTANRYEQQVIARFRLSDARTRTVLLEQTRPVSVTYDVADAPFAGIAASQDGQERAASEAARVIRTELARHFAQVNAAPATPVRTTLGR